MFGLVLSVTFYPYLLLQRLDGVHIIFFRRYVRLDSDVLVASCQYIPFSMMWWLVRNYIDRFYPHHLIGRGGLVAWKPRSTNRTVLDCFLWEYFNSCFDSMVYETPKTIDMHLFARIVEKAARVRDTHVHLNGLVNRWFDVVKQAKCGWWKEFWIFFCDLTIFCY